MTASQASQPFPFPFWRLLALGPLVGLASGTLSYVLQGWLIYLDIQRVRFGGQLRGLFDIAEDAQNVLVPYCSFSRSPRTRSSTASAG